ncbi:glycosyltransferase [Pluralibacter gergoviae]|uniref:glycosyltransferase n=1 Tax=Pluralibacter gergoviae TaxID=61647 RepID=UPI0009BE48EA|nr:glycosyltransferase [Pluralibacter gergoviae]EKW6619606.1 glycosyltransferase family 2 protein [Pluralibacter gergoviae]
MNKSREQLLQLHDNNYLKLLNGNKSFNHSKKVSVNIVIPLFNDEDIFNATLYHTLSSIKKAKESNPNLDISVTVIDDGSMKPYKFPYYIDHNWNIIRLANNRGRAFARNTGLQFRKKSKYTLFMDSDIILYPDAISEFIQYMEDFSSQKLSCIVCGLFHFISENSFTDKKFDFSMCNDFRLKCTYQESWIGCESDRQFIGTKFNIIKDTVSWSQWPNSGSFGPWILPNMVLGGLFCVNTNDALSVGGLDHRFSKYGFEETTLVTNLIIMKKSFIIPALNGFSKHVEKNNEQVIRNKKNKLFRRAHKLFFCEFMKELVMCNP